jgi:hypothetical protein
MLAIVRERVRVRVGTLRVIAITVAECIPYPSRCPYCEYLETCVFLKVLDKYLASSNSMVSIRRQLEIDEFQHLSMTNLRCGSVCDLVARCIMMRGSTLPTVQVSIILN